MPILQTNYYDEDKVHSTIKALADAANAGGATGFAGPRGPAGSASGAAGPTGPTGPIGPWTLLVPPTADPHVVGQIWNSGGKLIISAG